MQFKRDRHPKAIWTLCIKTFIFAEQPLPTTEMLDCRGQMDSQTAWGTWELLSVTTCQRSNTYTVHTLSYCSAVLGAALHIYNKVSLSGGHTHWDCTHLVYAFSCSNLIAYSILCVWSCVQLFADFDSVMVELSFLHLFILGTKVTASNWMSVKLYCM